ncbi:MAG TPA: MarR family transcriptional regulator [Miltoncostaeaceae bacterium]|nr:MarR family transcriptional regulator [Miltoncostaeaceae bacterium]
MSRESTGELIAEVGVEVRRHQNAQDAFDDVASVVLGINRTDLRCMDIVDQAGPITAGALARESGLSSGAATTVIDRLEAAGYVRRVRDTVDRRRVLVELTDEARRRASEVWGPIAEEAGRMFAAYDEAQLRVLRDFLRDAVEFLDRHRERVSSLGGPGP